MIKSLLKRLNLLPPSAAIAGIYTMVDNSRGVWKAPANVTLNYVDSPAEDIDDDHSGNNQDQPDDGSQVEVLFENEKADKRDKNDTHSRPNGVSYAYRNALQYDTQAIESRRVPQNGQYGRNEFGKLFALFQERSGYSFKNDSQKQDKVSFHLSTFIF